jgi:nucleolin
MGNLSYDVTEENLKAFFTDCKFRGNSGEGIIDIRWLTHQETGEFKGCCFLQFDDTRDVDEAVKKNGKSLLKRQVRLDYG